MGACDLCKKQELDEQEEGRREGAEAYEVKLKVAIASVTVTAHTSGRGTEA